MWRSHILQFLRLDLPVGPRLTLSAFYCIKEELEFRIFKLSSTDIARLKDMAQSPKIVKISSFAVLVALIWWCNALSSNKNSLSTLLNVIDIRPRTNPPFPSSYSANAVLFVGVSATCEDLENGPFSDVVEMISEGAKVLTNEYVKLAFNWLEMHRGVPHGDYMVGSSLRLGFDQVEHQWEKAMYSCHVVNHRKDICLFFPDAMNGRIDAMVALPVQDMGRFEAISHITSLLYCLLEII